MGKQLSKSICADCGSPCAWKTLTETSCENFKAKIPPTDRQWSYAVAIRIALSDDDAPLEEMDKKQISNYISQALENPENRRKIYQYTYESMKHYYELNKPVERKLKSGWYTDESLGGEWGLDASDFGAQAWGDS